MIAPIPARFAAKLLLGLALAPVAVATAAVADPADSSAWARSATSQLRLLSAGPPADGHYRGGVEIFLRPGAITYWRVPGDAGVPPQFSFAGSDNLAGVAIHYPAPRRYDEGGSQAFGYRNDVIFPIDVTPTDPRRPVSLSLTLNYAVCDTICVPASGQVKLSFSPKTKAGPAAGRIADFMGQVPAPFGGPDATSIAVTPLSDAAVPSWHVAISPPPADDADLFFDPPDGWWFSTSQKGDGFDLVLTQKPTGAAFPAHVGLTYADGDKAFESETVLAAPAPKP